MNPDPGYHTFMKRIIDLRSDTVTHPTPSMREAMARAEVGDDVYGEDPTVNRLEELAAERLGSESAIFVPTGTMGNQVAVHLHSRPGTEVIGEAKCHIFNYEMGGIAALSSAFPRPVAGEHGILEPEAVEGAIQPAVGYATPTSLIVLENTHNLAGGRIVSPARMRRLVDVARRHGLPVHLDGARIFNAAAALECPPSELTGGCDTVMFCLSKGLAAPVGSMLVGSEAHITEARRIRKLFGGGMRQVGVLAAAGLVALEEMVPRLRDDNRRARRLAEMLTELPGIVLDPGLVDTNIVFFGLAPEAPMDARSLQAVLADDGVLSHALDATSIRMVAHYHISDDDIEQAAQCVAKALGS